MCNNYQPNDPVTRRSISSLASRYREETGGARETNEGIEERTEHLQWENDRLRAQVKKRSDLDERDTEDSGQAKHPVVRDKGKKLISFDDVDSPVDDDLSSTSLPNRSLAKRKSNKDRSHQRHSHRPEFNNCNGGTFRRATGRGQNQPNEAPGKAFTLPTGAMPLQHILSSPLGQHILDYESPQGFIMPTFAMFDGSSDPYGHMLHYNQAMTLNAGDDHLLCKVFMANLQGPQLAWFHKLPCNSVNAFSEL